MFRLSKQLTEVTITGMNIMYPKVILQFKKLRLSIRDEWLLYLLKETELRDFLEIQKRDIKRFNQYSVHSLMSRDDGKRLVIICLLMLSATGFFMMPTVLLTME